MLFLENMTDSFEATNFMSRFKAHNCYLQKILFDLQYVQINLIKSLYNRVLCLTYSGMDLVGGGVCLSVCVCMVEWACALRLGDPMM